MMNRSCLPVLLCAAALGGCLATDDAATDEAAEGAVDASRQAFTAVSSFGSNPGNLRMFEHVPAGMPANAPLVIALHGCTQQATTYLDAGWNELADQWKFYVAYAEQQTANNQQRCFTWFSNGDISRGQGEALSIKQMVDNMKARHSIDPSRVFVTGLSAGGAMTAVMLATYPDVFRGGAVMAGLPYKCATSINETSTCQFSGVDKTPKAWGDLVRAQAPAGFTGPFPRVSIWQGAEDFTVRPINATELADQWTDVNGADATPDGQDTVGGAAHSIFKNPAGQVVVESYLIPKMGHGTAVDPGFAPAAGCGRAGSFILDVNLCSTYHSARFFGLDPNGGTGGSGGSGGTSGTGGSGGTAGTSGTGGTGGTGGSGGTAGTSGTGGTGGTGGSGGTCQAFTSSNFAHTSASPPRAVVCNGGHACAIGSNTDLGLWNTFVTTTLRLTAPNFYQLGPCP